MDLKKIYKNKSILITGGTGSFGKKFVEEILKYHKYIKRLVVFSRDELKQYELSKVYPNSNFTKLRFFIGDIRDKERLSRALKDINIVVHAAALKQVPTAEYNPFECIKTNIIGAQNLIEASLDNGIEKLIALSTDKAVSPINLYGATKLCADKLFVAANNIKGKNNIKFSVVRYGNVTSSRGSVIPFFKTLKNEKYLPVTHKDMTRFNISLNEAFELVNYGIQNMQGGEIFVPKLKSYSVVSLAKAMYPNKKIKFIGIRDGEKIHEDLISYSESLKTFENKKYYLILNKKDSKNIKYYKKKNFIKIKKQFVYSSDSNKFLNISQLKKVVRDF
mgnify:CR=1 FL=1|jgi:UDP-N-acetylglucosamine 4,6-dehydratase